MLAISIVYAAYCIAMLSFLRAWHRIPVETELASLAVSVVIPFRNEAKHVERLVKGFASQEHPDFELIFVDDHSEDNGQEKLLKALNGKYLNFRLIELTDSEGKKAALTKGIAAARYPLIVTTDADCFMDKHWLQAMINPFKDEGVQMVSGPVSFIKHSLFARWQAIEFQALIAIGAAGIARGRPTMANGANLAFRKSAFQKLDGYAHTADTPSGDDEFLLSKVVRQWPKGVCFQKNKEAVVVTEAPLTWKALKEQRIRWVSKWKKGGRKTTIQLAMLIALMQVAQLALYVSFAFLEEYWPLALVLIGCRLMMEALLVYRSGKELDVSLPSIGLFVLSFILYPFYSLYFALLANFGSFEWKGRMYR